MKRPLSDVDVAVYDLIRSALVSRGESAATLTQQWNDQAGMWLVEVGPVNPAAASLSIGYDGSDLLSIAIGRTWFELFPVRLSEDLPYLRTIVEAVFAGEVKEAGRSGRFFAKIGSGKSTINVGHVHLPLPRAARRWHRYAAYQVDG